MAINYAVKYGKEIAKVFTANSFVKPNCGGTLDFSGVKTVRISQLITNPEVDYTRKGSNRYGTPDDVQDTLLEYTMTQDKAFTGVVDKGDESDQAITNKASQWLQRELKEQCTPAADKYAFAKFAKLGTVVGTSAPEKDTILEQIALARAAMNDKLVPNENRVLYLPTDYVTYLLLSKQIIGADGLNKEAITKGTCGTVMGFKLVEIPTGFLPEGAYFMATYKQSVAMPYKISDTKIHTDAPGISGALIEGRHYYDAFVLGEKADGIYTAVASASKQATPTITISSGSATIASSGATSIYYTTDGSDPRFSANALPYTAAVKVTTGDKIRAVAYGTFTSDLAEKTA